MISTVMIGEAVVRLSHRQQLPEYLRGLHRIPAHSTPGRDIELILEPAGCAAWKLDVYEENGTHFFGRTCYTMEVRPVDHSIRLRWNDTFAANDLYWLQRDIFGAIGCLTTGLLLHAAALRLGDTAYVFCGPSGVGKSTLAAGLQSRGWQVINDELNWVYRTANGELWIVNQPFWFFRAEEPTLPVQGLYLLEQSVTCGVAPAPSKAESFARLLATHLSIDDHEDLLHARALKLHALLQQTGVPTLRINRNAEEVERVVCEAQP